MSYTLEITFAGICTHFRGVVPGVPHRVVLPNATSAHFGLIGLEEDAGFGSYYLLPHFPVLLFRGDVPCEPPTVQGVIERGVISTGARLQIANPAANQHLRYAVDWNSLPSISDFVPHYEFSDEVVLGGRAAAYFDIFAGNLAAASGQMGAMHVVAEIETDGPPALLVTPFGRPGSPGKPTILPIPSGCDLLVANTDVDPGHEDTPYDFLLQYLTSSRGIPQVLSKLVPGLSVLRSGDLPRTSHPQIAKALEALAWMIVHGRPTADQVAALVNVEDVLGVSCSDSQYP